MSLVSSVLLARTIGLDELGRYAFAISFITLIGLPTKAGIVTLIIREVAKGVANEEWGRIRGILQLANILTVVYSIFAMAITYGTITIVGWSSFLYSEAIIYSLPLLPLIAIGNIRGAALRGLKLVAVGNVPEQLIRPLVLTTCLLFSIYLEFELSSSIALVLTNIAAIAAFGFGAVILYLKIPKPVFRAKPEYQVALWLKSLVPLTIFSGLRTFGLNLSYILVGAFAAPTNLGLFKVAMSIASALGFSSSLMASVTAPRMVQFARRRELDNLQNLVGFSTLSTVLTTFPAIILIWIFGRPLISVLYGESVVDAWYPLSFLLIGQAITISSGTAATLLHMTEHEQKTMTAMALSLAVNVVTSLLLVTWLEETGVAIGHAVGLACLNISLMQIAYCQTGINTSISSSVNVFPWFKRR